ncbi:MAG: S41 family peptidase [Spirochaetia bacterium]|nr:S41 family peptidase [Spirochaetia bacterium]
MKKLKIYIIAIILIVSTAQVIGSSGVDEKTISTLFGPSTTTQTTTSADEITQNMRKLELLYRLVNRDFLFDIDHKNVYEEMAKGLFEGLEDEYSAYIVSKESSDFSEDTLGTYGGIGAYISKNYLNYRDFSKPETYMINITSVFPGSPAESAGLLSGDLVSHVDGEPVDDLEADQASKALKGEAGTVVTLTIRRGDITFDVKVTRKNVQVPTVSSSVIDKDIGYLQITQFTESTANQVIEKLRNINFDSLSSLIIDLRNNPGGIVDATLRIADMILDDGKIVQVHSKNAKSDKVYVASEVTLIPTDMPIVLLVNGGSASSSEILAGALKDNKRATLIGTTTFGKGLIQVVSPYEDGFYTLTWSQYKTPNGDDIHKVGIPVDIEIEGMKVDEENMESYLEFINSGAAETFAKENPNGSDEDYMNFIEQYAPKDSPLDDLVYKIVLRREYLKEIPFEQRPLADVDYDIVLKRAVDFIKTGK